MPRRLAFVIHRYVDGIGSGSERLCQALAELLAGDDEVTVLTTCADDYMTWENVFSPGEHDVNGVRVLRFCATPRSPNFDELSARLWQDPHNLELGQRWLRAQGGHAPGLLSWLQQHREEFDAVSVLPYVYATTVRCLPIIAGRAIMIPCAHDELPLRAGVYTSAFALPDAFVFNTPEEADLVDERFGIGARQWSVVGAHQDPPPPSDAKRFRDRFDLRGDYLLCLGRVDAAKGSDLALKLFAEVLAADPTISLVMMGELYMPVDRQRGLLVTGYVDEQTKHDAIAGATAVWAPSPYESLSLASLEAWAHEIPTIANAACAALAGQTRRSGGGLLYSDPRSFANAVARVRTSRDDFKTLGQSGRSFVARHYSRDAVQNAWQTMVDRVGTAARCRYQRDRPSA